MSMTRSKAQILRGFLPGQTFEHADDIIGRVGWVDTGSSGVDDDILFAALQRKLERWQRYEVIDKEGRPQVVSRASGFPDPDRFRDEYVLVEPINEVRYGLWPLMLRCINPACEKVVEFAKAEQFVRARDAQRCDKCGSPREQMPYIQVHHCGADATLLRPSCDRHDDDHVYLKDEGAFETSSWRCRARGCNGRYLDGMRFRGCGCGLPGGFVSRTVRQDDRFYVHTLDFVSFDRAPRIKLEKASEADKVVIGYWLGLIEDYEQALADASGSAPDVLATAQWDLMAPKLQELVDAGQMTSEDFSNMKRRVLGETESAFSAVTALVPAEVCKVVGGSQGAQERTMIWGSTGQLRKSRLADFKRQAETTGRRGTVEVIDEAQRELRDFGFSDLIVVENFPVALVAYGFTRLSKSPSKSQLRAFNPKSVNAKRKDKTPIFVIESNTEAVFFELDARRVLPWLVDQGLAIPTDLPDDDAEALLQAKAAVLREIATNAEAARRVYLLQHTMAHALIRNIGDLAGFAENTMSEYLIPDLLTFGVYADTHQEFTLGALVSLVEHRLGEWLEAAKEGARSCDWDPKCARDEGACMGCLHLSFGCNEFNDGLDRAVLFGSPAGHELVIDRGYWG